MAYRKVRGAQRAGPLVGEELQTAALDLDWDLEKELQEAGPGLERGAAGGTPSRAEADPGPDGSLRLSTRALRAPAGRPNYISPTSPGLRARASAEPAAIWYFLGAAGIFILGILIGHYAKTPDAQAPTPPTDTTDLLEEVLCDITADKIQALHRAQDVMGTRRGKDNTLSLVQRGLSGGFSASGAEVVDVQYGSLEDIRRVSSAMNVTKQIAVLKLGQAPLLYKLSLLADLGFGGVLVYVDPCDSPLDQNQKHTQAFGVTLNPGGDPSTPGYPSTAGSFREERASLTSLLVQPISASLARKILSSPSAGTDGACIPIASPSTSERKKVVLTVGSRSQYKPVFNVVGYLRGKTNPDRYVLVGCRHDSWHRGSAADWRGGAAIMTQLIAAVTEQARGGWTPDRTAVFSSWGGSALGNIGSFEWGEENRVVLQSNAVAYVSLHSPVRGTETLLSTSSPSLLQLTSDIQKRQLLSCIRGGNCPGPNVRSLQGPGDVSFFANHLAVPTTEFAFLQTTAEEV
ncbi:inactive N-acetylated-alpha-linked acidic dipeptidase-like protein 2 [Osmerus mordax]|uniref:inactive N-acetylated-alpha-linked acidic dipeptidase-like protein 2 n=1 Tax=Osmerus mordax TaxID=8014 RepID=UPI00350EDFB0